jgi:tRNA threonylcarbamoyladenosine biosynthesis protein TsaE
MIIHSESVEQTRSLGAAIAKKATPGQVYALIGALGAGKTEFVRGFALALNPSAHVRSPSFTLMNIYETQKFPIYHFDFYRLAKPGELVEIGFQEYINGNGVCLIEWADMFEKELPGEVTTIIRFTDEGETKRKIEVVDE